MTAKDLNLAKHLNHFVDQLRHDVRVRRDLYSLNNDHAVGPSAACSRDTDCVVRGTCCANGASCSSTVQPGFNDANFQSQSANCPTLKATNSNLTVDSQSLHVRLDTSDTDITDKKIKTSYSIKAITITMSRM